MMLVTPCFAQENIDISQENDPTAQGLVEVESSNVLPSDLANIYKLVPYNVRRPKWGSQVSLAYSQYTPKNYSTDYLATVINYEDAYGSPQMPLIEISYMYKYNFALGSAGVDVGYGFYKNEAAEVTLGDAQLDLKLARLGGRFTLDNYLPEPIVAPYVFGGVYMAIYDETKTGAGQSFNGTTGPAGYWGIGVLAQMNWLDKAAALESYTEAGIENTYLFLEARQYLASSENQDPDFSTDLDLAFGLSLEF